MGIVYTQTDTTTDCADFSACATGTVGSTNLQTEIVSGATGGTTEQSISVPSGSSRLAGFMQTSGGVGTTTWESGTYTVRFNVTTGDMDVDLTGIWLCRINSSCTSQASVGSDTTLSTTMTSGTYSFNISGSQQSASESDDLYIVCEFTNNHNMVSGSIGVTPDQNIDTPIVLSQAVSEVVGTPPSLVTSGNIVQPVSEVVGISPVVITSGIFVQSVSEAVGVVSSTGVSTIGKSLTGSAVVGVSDTESNFASFTQVLSDLLMLGKN